MASYGDSRCEIPSLVESQHKILLSRNEEEYSKKTWKTSGKWVLYGDVQERDREGLTEFDRLYRAIKELFDEGKLMRVKCATAMGNLNPKWIYCYTPDSNDIEDVRKTGDMIWKKTRYSKIMHYFRVAGYYYYSKNGSFEINQYSEEWEKMPFVYNKT